MKRVRILLWILMLLPLVATVAALFFLPDRIPAHYGFDGTVDRWGSKYETLVFPVLSIVTGAILLAMSRVTKKHDPTGKNEIALLWAGVGCGVMFSAMTAYFLFTDFRQVQDLNAVPIALTQILFMMLGALLVLFGVLLPGTDRNPVFGFRTKKTMESEENWDKAHRFVAVSLIVAGVLMVAAAIFTRGAVCFAVCTALLIAAVAADAIYVHKM